MTHPLSLSLSHTRQGAVIEEGAEVGAGSVVPPGRLVPAGEHWAGNPVAYVGKARSNVALRKVRVTTHVYVEEGVG